MFGGAVASASVVGIAASSVAAAVVAFLVVAITLLIVGFLMANQEGRTANLVSGMADSVATSAVPAAPQEQAAPMPSAPPIPSDPGSSQPPLVAVVITAWNESRFISTAIESVLSQSIQRFECIVVDDGSTDDTLNKVLQLVGHDARFTVLEHESNEGLAAARNTGLAAVKARYVTFLDGDDFLYPESLEMRLSQLVMHQDKPWVGGVYCQWSNVPELSVPGPAPAPKAKRRTVTWLNSLADAPFIATAPLMRVEVARSVGGFPDANTAEDTLFWNKVLREGYIFTPVHHVGVAYRMKRVSMFRSTAVEHANLIADGLALNDQPTDGLSESGPYPFTEAAGEYIWEVTFVKRMIAALASAVEAGDDVATAETAQVVRDSLHAYHLWDLPLETVIRSQASRVSRYVSGAEFTVHRETVAGELGRLLEARTAELLDEVKARQATLVRHVGPSGERAVTRLEPQQRLLLSSAVLARPQSVVDGRVILMPGAAYHVDEFGPISAELGRLGIETVVMVSERRWPAIERAQAAYETPVVAAIEAGPWMARVSGVVVMNDWGIGFKEYVETANELGVATFAKVEGVQDFEDVDTGRERTPYRRARWILAQGQNDVTALPEKETIVVSNSRLERIWFEAPREPGPPLVAVNVNFTYDVLVDARDMWVASVAGACEEAGLPFVLSLHPAEKDHWSGAYPIAATPMRHLLTQASVLVSRFSTIPFEAMARGVPFVYHNPHGEKVPTFQEPGDAFASTRSESELTAALVESMQWQGDYRDYARSFFLRQVAVDAAASAASRAARAIAERIDPHG